jgi:hypothetical protein
MTSAEPPSQPADFIVTKEYRRFAEFCEACREARYIGLCYGLPGVGKTVSARQYAHWNQLEALLGGSPPYRHAPMPPHDSGPWQTVLYTPGVTNTPRSVEQAVGNLWGTVDGLGARATWYADPNAPVRRQPPDLLLVDEADRLKTASLEQLRDFYDRRQVGMVLIGMPGLQKRLARYAQLYSRVRLRPSVPTSEWQGTARRHRASVGAARPGHGGQPASRYRRGQRHRARHGRQLSLGPAPLCPDRAHCHHQQPARGHDRGRHPGAGETGRRRNLEPANLRQHSPKNYANIRPRFQWVQRALVDARIGHSANLAQSSQSAHNWQPCR